ncbi:hypothetical protein MHYP_G00337390 [Metynnis hypsauchen]
MNRREETEKREMAQNGEGEEARGSPRGSLRVSVRGSCQEKQGPSKRPGSAPRSTSIALSILRLSRSSEGPGTPAKAFV